MSQNRCEGEKIDVVVVENFPELGKQTALRFLKWAQANPGGVISLPTGKTPQHFIQWVQHLLHHWDGSSKQVLEQAGIPLQPKPDMASLTFVQIDEFFPIDPNQANSFAYYVRNFYLKGFGLDESKALLIDCNEICPEHRELWPTGAVDLTVRDREPTSDLERRQKEAILKTDAWCVAFEEKIRQRGGIGFFLGGIGPDGHIAFNVRGSAHDSITRLMVTNYETQAAASSDLGGIEVARYRPVITIGLDTIAFKKDAVAIIMAAGEAKAEIVASSVLSDPDPQYPATVLQQLPNALFLITHGAAKLLPARKLVELEKIHIDNATIEHYVVELSLKLKKPVLQITSDEAKNDAALSIILRRTKIPVVAMLANTHNSLLKKVEQGSVPRSKKTFLHTEPHHDDIMLAYLPALLQDVHEGSSKHYFTTLTSGFTAVTNRALNTRIEETIQLVEKGKESISDKLVLERATHFLGAAKVTCNLSEDNEVVAKLKSVQEYLSKVYAGQKDVKEVQILKGSMRECEAEMCWGELGVPASQVSHLRLGFYQGDLFSEEPEQNRDIPPVVNLINACQPDIITVALDPEASGPDTHYKVLQAVATACKTLMDPTSEQKLPAKSIWGYRNIWFRFHPSECSLMVPIPGEDLDTMHRLFMDYFVTQREASFPSYEYDGPFTVIARRIQEEQLAMMKTCLGEEYFQTNELLRTAKGMIYIKAMDPADFIHEARALQKQAEAHC